MRFALLLAFSLVALPVQAQQSELHVNPGVRVRVGAPELSSMYLRGSVVSFTADTLTLQTDADGFRLHVPNASIRSVDISFGRDRVVRSLRGAGLGVVGGLVVGVAISEMNDLDLASIPMTLTTMLLGGAGGALVGAVTAPERWMSTYRSTVAPRPEVRR